MGLLDKYILTTENFERCIINTVKMPNLLILFRKTQKEMDDWCLENYGLNFQTTYEYIRNMAIENFMGVMNDLGERGNGRAIDLVSKFLCDAQDDKVVKVVFDNKMKMENDEDKANG